MSLLSEVLSTLLNRRADLKIGNTGSRSADSLAEELLVTESETIAMQLAQQLLATFRSMDDDARLAFFRYLAAKMGLDPERIRAALKAHEEDPTMETYAAYLAVAEPRRQELIRRLNRPSGATHELVNMRAELLRMSRQDPILIVLDMDFRHLFGSWFNRGFLVLRPISWGSPAHVLEKIIAYEAVHAIDSWAELQRRLAPADRRCFAFFHPAMPDEPLIFVEVALTLGIPTSVDGLLDDARRPIAAEEADTAVFYSISNCQPGLAGISFGNSLIKQVAADLKSALPELATFVTLSPIPGLARWLDASDVTVDRNDPIAMRNWAAWYLLTARRDDGQPVDPVARFHLLNGATLHAVHARADTSPKGVTQSGGAMVNYLYDFRTVEANHNAYSGLREIRVAAEVRSMADSVKSKKIEMAEADG